MNDPQPTAGPSTTKTAAFSEVAPPPSADIDRLPAAQAPPTPTNTANAEQGNLDILHGTDGKLKRMVTLDVARRFGGVSRRAIEKAITKGALDAEGEHRNRRILVKSLLKYFPSEK